jgi:hypothetical protein
MDSYTLRTAHREKRKKVTVGLVWVVAACFVLWTVKSEFMKNI